MGLVHDDNCRALGGVAGHAGLFGSAEGVLNLCKEYLNLSLFERNGIEVLFQEFHHPVYRQLYGNFVPGLSIIDIMMNSQMITSLDVSIYST